MTRRPAGFLLTVLVTAVWSLPIPGWAQDGVVLTVRPGSVVVDVSAMDEVQAGTRLGFVREDGERQETGQGQVLQVKDGKASVKLAPNSKVRKGDLVVVCPDPDDDPYAELRDVVDELQGQAKAQPRSPRSAKLRTLTREAVSALEARDRAVADGKCDVAELDEQVSQAASQLAALTKSRESSRRQERSPAKAEAPEAEESTSGPGPQEATRPPELPRETTGTTPRSQSGAQTALDLLSRVVKALPSKTESRGGTTEEAPTGGVEEKDSVQTTVDLISRLADSLPEKKKKRARRGSEAPQSARVELGPAESAAQAPGAPAPPPIAEPAEEKAAPPEARRPPKSDVPPADRVKPLALRGRVVNGKGEPIAGARVVSGDLSVVTNVEGFFRLVNLKPGQHEISVTAPGFNPRKRMVSIEPGQMPPVTFVLRRE